MKTIEITDEQYEFLKEAKELLKTQDNRCTRDPIYCIMEKKRIYGYEPDYASDFIWVWDDEEIADNTNNIFQQILDYYDEETILDLWESLDRDNAPIDEIIKKLNEELDSGWEYQIEDFLEGKNIKKVYYRENYELSQQTKIFSLFEKDAKEYVESKKSNVFFDYAESTCRSNRMKNLINFLKTVDI